jgi:hypothetical protein
MATKKQRRRREKERRHDYEYVYVDSEGEEVEVDEPEEKPREERTPTSGIKPTPGTKSKAAAKPASRTERVVDPPSWDRTLKRAAIFVPIMLIFLYLTRPANSSTGAIVLQAVFIIVLLIAFMYLMDSFLYRAYQKRQAKRDGGSPPKTK